MKIIVPITDWKENYVIAPWMVKIEPVISVTKKGDEVENTGISNTAKPRASIDVTGNYRLPFTIY